MARSVREDRAGRAPMPSPGARSRATRPTPALPMVAVVLAVAATVLWRLPGAVRALRDANRIDITTDVVAGRPIPAGLPEGARALFDAARAQIPQDGRVRLVVPSGASCEQGGAAGRSPLAFVAGYQLVPRIVDCTPGARWWLYLGVSTESVAPPPGASVERFGPEAVLVSTAGAGT